MGKGKHLKSVAHLREGDFTPKELAFVLSSAQAAKAEPSDVIRACIRMAELDASKVGVPWFLPRLRRFL